jgi:flagellar M-ring protein FliF
MAESALDTSSMPATQAAPGGLPSTLGGGAVAAPAAAVSNFQAILSQPAVQRTLPAVIMLFSLAALFLLYNWLNAPSGRVVYADLSESDRQAAFDSLIASNMDPYIDAQSGQLMVPGDQYHQARMYLASQNLPRSSGVGGFQSLLENGSMTTSRNMEAVNIRAAMEAELAQTIRSIGAIKNARVHIAEPQQSVFLREQEEAKASVVVDLMRGRVLSRAQIQAMVNLVAASIPYLPAENVTVVDSMGKLLTGDQGLDPAQAMTLTAAQTSHEQGVEASYQTRIDQILAPLVGRDNLRAEVDVAMNFTETEATFEQFNPNGSDGKLRSESRDVEEQTTNQREGGTFQATPPVEGQNGQDERSTSSTTRNYELDREIRYVKQQVGSIDRVSVAVVVNEAVIRSKLSIGLAEGETVAQEAIDAELLKLEEVVMGVIGFDPDRGDLVTVIASNFTREDMLEPEDRGFMGYFENPTVIKWVEMGLSILMVLLAMLFVVRPLVKFYTSDKRLLAVAGMPGMGELSVDDVNRIRKGDGDDLEDIKTKLMPKRSPIPEDMFETANTYEDKIAVMKMMVASDPGRVANLIKRMVNV